ncbi:MAG TPA: tetratricopeptide repeat protein [Terriglobales bacterium]|nr:tetratricopeptide repeat protein [Terriglobales bacterium]
MATANLVGTGANKGLLIWMMAGVLVVCVASAPAQTRKTGSHRRIPSDETLAARAVTEAEADIEKKDWAAAERELREAVAKDAKNYRAWFDLGFVFNETDRRPEAIDAYRKSVAAQPDVFESTLNLGMLLAASGSAEAETFLRAATKLKPTEKPQEGWARTWGVLGDVLKEKNPAEALSAYAEAAKFDPKDPRPRLAAGGVLERQGNLKAAETEFQKALELDPNSAEALEGLVQVHTQGKRWAEAEAALRQLLKLEPANAAARVQLGRVLMELGRKDEGVAELEAAAKDSTDPVAERELAAFYLEAKQYEPAALHYRRLLSRDPKNAELHHALGLVLTGQGKFAEAEAVLVAAVNSDPKLKEAYFDLAFAAQRNKDYATAIQALDTRARFYPENPGTYFMRATAYDSLKDFKQAAQNYHQFLLVANGKYPDEEWKARHRLKAIEPK